VRKTQTVNLYRYKNEDGSISITPNKISPLDPVYKYRLIADEGEVLTDGDNEYYCVDTDDEKKYSEVFMGLTITDTLQALNEMGVSTDD